MSEQKHRDALDEIVDDVGAWLPGVDVDGLAVTGRVLRLAHHLEAGREAVLEDFGLTVGDFDMLATLRRRAVAGSLKIRDLQRSLMLSSGGTTKRLDRLEDAGLIERHPDPNDRRGTLISLSPAGRALIDDAVPAVIGAEAVLVREAIGDEPTRAAVVGGLRQLLLAHEAHTG